MKSVFVVTCGTYSDYCIWGVFTTRELAEQTIVGMTNVWKEAPEIHEWLLNTLIEEK